MRSKKSSILLFILVIQLLFVSLNFNESKIDDFYSNNDLAENTIIINSFEDFKILFNETHIYTNKTSERLSFIYIGESSEYLINETLFLDLSSYGNITDFTFSIEIEYNYLGTHWGRSAAELGSYYWENGTYSGTPIENKRKILAQNTVVDAWDSYLGRYNIQAYPNDEFDKYTSERILSNSGDAVFNISRFISTLNSTTYDEGLITFTHEWYEGIEKPVNYLWLDCEVYPDFTNSVNITYSSLYLSFEVETPTETQTESQITFILKGFTFIEPILLVSVIGYLIKRKKS